MWKDVEFSGQTKKKRAALARRGNQGRSLFGDFNYDLIALI
jgi:hypothetical protein